MKFRNLSYHLLEPLLPQSCMSSALNSTSHFT